MGTNWIDQYSLLHFSVGVIAYFWSMNLLTLIIIHIIFEYVENTKFGIKFINNYFIRWWPGGKEFPDNTINSISDTLFSILGWYVSYLVNIYYK